MKKTLVVGATEKQYRYSNKAVRLLSQEGFEVIAIGKKEGTINGIPIATEWSDIPLDIHTITLYISPKYQNEELIQKVLSLSPQRIIFNPGTENDRLLEAARHNSIEAIEACTLLMLRLGSY